jgi:hypothetical protein
MSEAGSDEEQTQGWAGAIRTLKLREQQQERVQEDLESRKILHCFTPNPNFKPQTLNTNHRP